MEAKQTVECPFCKGVITRDLERHGGACPHCLLEIPGDDADTDPGLILKQKQAEEQQKAVAKHNRGNWMIGTAALCVFVMAIGGGFWWNNAREEAMYYDPQVYFQAPLEEINLAEFVAEGEAAKAEIARVAQAEGTSGNSGGPTNGSGTPKNPKIPDIKVVVPQDSELPQPIATNSGGRNPGGVRGSSNPPPLDAKIPEFGQRNGATGMDIASSSGARPTGTALTERTAIEEMVQRVSKVYNSQIGVCYEQRQKAILDLKGIWTLSFTILPNGGTRDVRARGGGISDPELEQCMVRAATTWKFEPLATEFKVTKQYRLSPAGW